MGHIPAARSRPRRACAAPCRRSRDRPPPVDARSARAAGAQGAVFAARLVVAWLSARRDCARFVFGLLGADLILCHALFELADQELELLDVAVEFLRGTAEARPTQQ